jgi:ectoine hydroxylase-related dioxygenase (phytanoyl-CoA dioxygenase family)
MKRKYSDTINSLHEDGFVVLNKLVDVSPELFGNIVSQCDKNEGPIFNHRKYNDNKRKQRNLITKSKHVSHFLDVINSFLSASFSNLHVNDWVIIHSLPGCKAQAAHTDYIPSELSSEIPINVLVALQDDTSLDVWPNSHKFVNCGDLNGILPINKKIVNMNKGDVLLFRGDFVHAGSAYLSHNYRLHCYLDSSVIRKKNTTWIIHKHASKQLQQIIL